mmetsp:Transcript_63521/g.73073  ORF Transcript_63521/g.73073 Transcript_63521/m.73073 type:complete len:1022 (+) Transcript_63521:83-3148(+)
MLKMSLLLLFYVLLLRSSYITAFRSITSLSSSTNTPRTHSTSFSRTIVIGEISHEINQNNDNPSNLRLSSSSDQNEVTNPPNTVTIEKKNNDEVTAVDQSQVLASGFSQNMDMVEALQEAVAMAIASLPPLLTKIDLAVVSVSSLYDGNYRPSLVVPTILEAASSYGNGIQHLVGSTCGGLISSKSEPSKQNNVIQACQTVEREGVPGVSIVLCILPDVQLRTFHVTGEEVPDGYGKMSSKIWKTSIGLSTSSSSTSTLQSDVNEKKNEDEPVVLVLPSPAMSNKLDDFLRGMDMHIPGCKVFGAVASTVSSLTRARLFRYDATAIEIGDSVVQTLADGCVGVVMEGDITVQSMIAQGAKPVGGVYQIVKGQDTTISAVALDENATELLRKTEDDSDNDEDDDRNDRAFKMTAAYAKAIIPKPVLAEANFVMKTLSDDDQTFMRKTLLVGVERSGSFGRTPSELGGLAEEKNHGYSIHAVASASMKDGSVTLSRGSVVIEAGSRMRFFVRESDFAKKEVEALLRYKKHSLESTLTRQDAKCAPSSPPTGCFLFSTLDRGSKFFSGKSGYESSAISEYLPSVPCISGFFANGVIGSTRASPELSMTKHESATMNGSASGYFFIGSKSGRPIYPVNSASDDTESEKQKEDLEESNLAVKVNTSQEKVISFDEEKKAPRDEKGELILKRREVNSGRAMTVSTVEWSVAENMAKPTSVLEGFMWDKETEVDRFRERVPLANLVSQCRLSVVDPSKSNPRDWIGPLKEIAAAKGFVIVPECKRTEPMSGSLRKRYNVSKVAKDFTVKGARAISVNCDAIMFGGSLDDLTKARESSSKAALESSSGNEGVVVPPILASDLLLYPYQLYKIRLAGADAVNLVVGALANKDLVYLTKIASSLQMQSLLTVTSAAQVKNLDVLAANSISGLIVSNRELEDFSFDTTGLQALNILRSDELKVFREKHGSDIPVLVEGRVGIIQSKDNNGDEHPHVYIQQLKDAGATGAVVGGGLVPDEAGISLLDSFLKSS